MKVYVAASRHQAAEARLVIGMCEAVGWTIAYDWTKNTDDIRADWSSSPELAREIALAEMNACKSADIVIWLWSNRGTGAFWEAAWGASSRGELWVVGHPGDSVFFKAITLKKSNAIGGEHCRKIAQCSFIS